MVRSKFENRLPRLEIGTIAGADLEGSAITLHLKTGDGEESLPVVLERDGTKIALTCHAGWGDVRQTIYLTETPCHFGGNRTWFLCPLCDRRCGILYLTKQFACRHCSKLRYASQYESPRERMRRRLIKIRKLIGPDLVIGHPLNPPPKGMSVKRWHELADEYAALRKLYFREGEKPCAWREDAPTARDWKQKVKTAVEQAEEARRPRRRKPTSRTPRLPPASPAPGATPQAR